MYDNQEYTVSLFQNIPENLFSVLSSPNRVLYVEALFALRDAFKREITIERDVLHLMLADRLGEQVFNWQDDDLLPDGEPDQPVSSLTDLARILLRRLEQTGWLEIEYKQTSFEELITLPPYAVSILDVLWSLTEEARQEYGRHAFFAYTMLKSADALRHAEQDKSRLDEAWMALEQAAREAEKLLDALKTLRNNIRRYHRRLSEAISTEAILQGHFDEFQVLVNERIYHPLKTRDAVQRYKVPVLGLCDSLLSDAAFLDQLAANTEQEPAQAHEQLFQWLRIVYDVFDSVDMLLGDIDQKNRAYTRASADRLLTMLNEEDNMRGYLIKLIAGARQLPPDRRQILLQSPALFRQSVLGRDALYMRAVSRINKDEKPLTIDTASEAISLQAQQGHAIEQFLRDTANRYSQQKVIDYVLNLLEGRDAISSDEINLASDEAYILTLLAVVRQYERQMPYQISMSDPEKVTRCGRYRIPIMTISRKTNPRGETHD